MNKRRSPIGIIAEDDSDVSCIKIFIRRIKSDDRIGVKKFVGKGCGKIKRKANIWAQQLKTKGCKKLILVHDLDQKNIDELKKDIENALSPSPIKDYLICIPIKELEAWLLADPESIKQSLNLPKKPKISRNPENISSPKEKLGELIQSMSNNEKIYLNTKHNEIIAGKLSIDLVKDKCSSFRAFYEYVETRIR